MVRSSCAKFLGRQRPAMLQARSAAMRSDLCKTLNQGLTREHFGRRVSILGKEKPAVSSEFLL